MKERMEEVLTATSSTGHEEMEKAFVQVIFYRICDFPPPHKSQIMLQPLAKRLMKSQTITYMKVYYIHQDEKRQDSVVDLEFQSFFDG